MKSLSIRDLNFSYTPDEKILDRVNLDLDMGEFTVIIGGNGSGKSTLIKNVLGELKPSSGTVEILGKPIQSYDNYKDIGYVPQMSVVEKIAFPITVTEMVVLNLYEDFGFLKFPKKEHIERTHEVLDYMELTPYKDYPVNELSGGLQQRSMIARAMINNPKILILDEPTVGVDKVSRAHFLKMIQRLNDERDLTILLVTHELDEVEKYAEIDSIYEIKDGRLEVREVANV